MDEIASLRVCHHLGALLFEDCDDSLGVHSMLIRLFRRDKRAAKRVFMKLLKGLRHVPRVIVTDKLGSYGAARKEVLPSVTHVQERWRNNRAEVSHQVTRQRERQMRRFKSMRHAQCFLSSRGAINNLLRLCRHGLKAKHYRYLRGKAFAEWR